MRPSRFHILRERIVAMKETILLIKDHVSEASMNYLNYFAQF